MKNSGIAVHVRHNILFEWCYDLKGRIEIIDRDKPENERPIRKKLLRLLTKEEIAMLPAEIVKCCKEYGKACQNREEADQNREEADQKWEEAYQKWKEADQKRKEAYQKYKPILEEIHKKICGCKEWNGKEMVFE